MMKLYEFVNPSDMITFYAPDDDIAQAVVVCIGKGKAGLRNRNDDEMPPTMFILQPFPDDIKEKLKNIIDNRFDEFLVAAHSFAVCGFGERELYDDYTQNGTDKEKVEKWDDKKRSSIIDWCKYARGFKRRD